MEMEAEGNEMLKNELSKYIKTGDKVCEIGSGSCSQLKGLIEKYGIKGYGVDPYGIVVENQNPSCYKLEAEKLSSLGEKFNIIYSVRSFHHIQWPEIFLDEAFKSLEEGGLVITIDWKWGTKTGIHERYYSLSEMIELYESSGFKILKKIDGQYNFCITGQKM